MLTEVEVGNDTQHTQVDTGVHDTGKQDITYMLDDDAQQIHGHVDTGEQDITYRAHVWVQGTG